MKSGLGFLAGLAHFDEVVSGMSVRNLGVEQYIDGAPPGPLAYPQVLILRRITQVATGAVSFRNERVVERAVGAYKIIALAKQESLLSQKN